MYLEEMKVASFSRRLAKNPIAVNTFLRLEFFSGEPKIAI
jgi:hypothetical protein